jgi:hypothetical protein
LRQSRGLIAEVAKGSNKFKNRLIRVGCIGSRAQDHLALVDEQGYLWSDDIIAAVRLNHGTISGADRYCSGKELDAGDWANN